MKCQVCGNPLIQRAHESKNRFSHKRFCSSVCWRKFAKENKQGWWAVMKDEVDNEKREREKEDITIEKIIEEIRTVESRIGQVDQWLSGNEICKYLGISK